MSKEIIEIHSAHDSLVLKANLYIPESEPIGVVQIIHGMAEHKERYDTMAQVLNHYGYVVLVADNRGHGESISSTIPLGYFSGNNGWIRNLQDIHSFSIDVQERYPSLPFFVIGHSMGSLIAHSYLKRYEDCLSGIIFSGMPAENSTVSAGKILCNIMSKVSGAKKQSKLIASMMDFNKVITNPATDFDWLSYNKENVAGYINDPLCGFPFTNKGYYDMLDGMEDVYRRKDWRVLKKDLPIFFVVGQDDPCADVPVGFKKALNNLSKAGYRNIKANIYEDMRHEIFNETEKEKVFSDIVLWLNTQIDAINEEVAIQFVADEKINDINEETAD